MMVKLIEPPVYGAPQASNIRRVTRVALVKTAFTRVMLEMLLALLVTEIRIQVKLQDLLVRSMRTVIMPIVAFATTDIPVTELTNAWSVEKEITRISTETVYAHLVVPTTRPLELEA
jgi:hypothetical protein